MSDVNWREVNFYKFDPNVLVEVELAFDKPQNLTGEYGAWWKWGVYIGGEPYLIKSGEESSLLSLIQATNKTKGDTLELVYCKKDDKNYWMVDALTAGQAGVEADKVNSSSKIETAAQIPPESGIDKMVNSLQKIQKYLDEVQMKLVSQKQAINKLKVKIKSIDEDDVPF